MRNDAVKRHVSVFASFAAFFVVMRLLSPLVPAVDSPAPRDVLAEAFPYLAGAVAAAAVVLPFLGRKKTEKKGKTPITPCLVCLAGLFAAEGIFLIFSHGEAEKMPADVFAVRFVLGVLVKPLVEEFIFRVSYVDLLEGLPDAAAVAVQAIMFALIHPAPRAVALVCGVMLGILSLSLKRRGTPHRLAWLFAVHATFNLVMYAALALSF